MMIYLINSINILLSNLIEYEYLSILLIYHLNFDIHSDFVLIMVIYSIFMSILVSNFEFLLVLILIYHLVYYVILILLIFVSNIILFYFMLHDFIIIVMKDAVFEFSIFIFIIFFNE